MKKLTALDILNYYEDNSNEFRAYLYIDNKDLLDKCIIAYVKDGAKTLQLSKDKTSFFMNDGEWFVDLLLNGLNINVFDKCKQFVFDHFSFDEDKHLVFVYTLDMNEVDNIFDNIFEASNYLKAY